MWSRVEFQGECSLTGSPFKNDDKPTYAWKYPDPEPYKAPHTDIDWNLYVPIFFILGICLLSTFFIFMINERIITPIERGLETMSCHELTLRTDINNIIVVNKELTQKYLHKCHPELSAFPTQKESIPYFKKLTCAQLEEHIKYHDFYLQNAIIEDTLRCS